MFFFIFFEYSITKNEASLLVQSINKYQLAKTITFLMFT